MCVPSVIETELVAARAAAGDRGGEDESGVVGAVDREFEERGLGLVQQLDDVGAREARGNQAEGRQGRVAPADGGIGVEDAVARRRAPLRRAASRGR